MCDCVNVEIGSYANQVELPRPQHMMGDRDSLQEWTICIDKCLVDEIKALWAAGIWTTGCCCGHNKLNGYIGVINDDIPIMKAMGYVVAPNDSRPQPCFDEDSFYPKSTHILLQSKGGR